MLDLLPGVGSLACRLCADFAAKRLGVCLVISPPLFVGLSAAGIKAFRGTPYVYVVQEALSDVLKHLGLVPAPAVAAIRLMEKVIYRYAAAVVAISPSMKQLLVQSGVPAHKVHVIENFAFGEPAPTDATRHEGEPPTITYLGNLGPAQDLDTVIQAAALLQDTALRFVLAGNGTRIEEIRAKTANLANVEVRDPMPLPEALALTAASTACLVLQAKGTGSSALPSKIYQIMSNGRPVIAVCDADSGVADILSVSGAGLSVEPGDAAGLAEHLKLLISQPSLADSMGQAGVAYVNANATEEVVTAAYLRLLEDVAAAHTGKGLLRGLGTRRSE